MSFHMGSDGNTNSFSFPLVDENGTLNTPGLENFAKAVNLTQFKHNYATVSIIGPQSSGKSTLLNSLFGTNFREMNAFNERCRATKGIWLAKSTHRKDCILVMDLEGTDGEERQDDIIFDRQTALFALAVSDVVLINMWSHDVGRDHAANIPLLRIIFQVRNHLYSAHKVNLVFVLRDKPNATESTIKALRNRIQEVYENSLKPKGQEDAQLSEVFNVDIVLLSSLEYRKDDFRKEVENLRQKLVDSVLSNRLAGGETDIGLASDFGISVTKIWNEIKENKFLHLPSYKSVLATIRCEEIAGQKLSALKADEGWLELKARVDSLPAKSFGNRLRSIIGKYLSEYDMDTKYYDNGISTEKKNKMIDDLRNLTTPVCIKMMENIQIRSLDEFEREFDKLKKREKFVELFMIQFKDQCTDVIVKELKWNFLEDTRYLKFEKILRQKIDWHVEEAEKRKREKWSSRVMAAAEAAGVAAAAAGAAAAGVGFIISAAGVAGVGLGVATVGVGTLALPVVFSVAQLGLQVASSAFKYARHLQNRS